MPHTPAGGPPMGQVGYASGPPLKKSKLPWILGGGAVVVAAGVAVLLVFTLGGGGGSSSARGAAEAYAKAVSTGSEDKSIYCESFKAKAEEAAKGLGGLDQMPAELKQKLEEMKKNVKATATVSDVKESGDTGTATVEVKTDMDLGLGVKIPPAKHKLTLKNESGWKVCDVNVGMAVGG